MKQLFLLIGLVCLIAVLLPACAPASEPEPAPEPEPVFDQVAEEAAIRAWMEQLVAAYNAHDAKACADLMDEDLQTWDGTIKGRTAAETDFFAPQFEQSKDIAAKLLEDIGIVFVTPAVAIHTYRFELSNVLDADGKSQPPQRSLGASVLTKKGGKWLRTAIFSRPLEP